MLWIDAASFLVSAAIVVAGVPRAEAPHRMQGSGYVAELRAGYAFLRGDRTLFVLVAVLTLTNMLDSISIVSLPVYASTVYGSAVSLGLMMGVMGAGSVLGALAFSAVGDRVPRRRVFIWGFMIATVWYPVAAAFPPLIVLLTAKLVAGLAAGPINPVIDTVFFERVPADMRGRVFGVTQASAWLAMPFGVLLAGPMLETIGLRATLVVTGGLYLTIVLVARVLPALRGLDPQRPPVPAAGADTVTPSLTPVSSDPACGRGIDVTERPGSHPLRVVAGPEPVDDHDGLVPDDPRVMPARERRDVARLGRELRAVVHADREAAGHVVLEVRRLAALRPGDRLQIVGPTPPWLEHEPADLGIPHLQDVGVPVRELADLVRVAEPSMLGLLHRDPPTLLRAG